MHMNASQPKKMVKNTILIFDYSRLLKEPVTIKLAVVPATTVIVVPRNHCYTKNLSVRLSVVLCQTLVSWKSSQKAINRKMTTFWWFFKKLSKEIFYRGLYHFSTIKCTYLNSSLSLGIFFTKIQLRPTLSPLFQSLRFIGPNFVQG